MGDVCGASEKVCVGLVKKQGHNWKENKKWTIEKLTIEKWGWGTQ